MAMTSSASADDGWSVTMTSYELPAPSAYIQAAALRAAFPQYTINLVMKGSTARFEAVSRDGGNPYCLISTDAREIWQALRGS